MASPHSVTKDTAQKLALVIVEYPIRVKFIAINYLKLSKEKVELNFRICISASVFHITSPFSLILLYYLLIDYYEQ
jgi:hypothetical protein